MNDDGKIKSEDGGKPKKILGQSPGFIIFILVLLVIAACNTLRDMANHWK